MYPVSLDILHQIFQRFGKVLKIVTFTKNNSFQVSRNILTLKALHRMDISRLSALSRKMLDRVELKLENCQKYKNRFNTEMEVMSFRNYRYFFHTVSLIITPLFRSFHRSLPYLNSSI